MLHARPVNRRAGGDGGKYPFTSEVGGARNERKRVECAVMDRVCQNIICCDSIMRKRGGKVTQKSGTQYNVTSCQTRHHILLGYLGSS